MLPHKVVPPNKSCQCFVVFQNVDSFPVKVNSDRFAVLLRTGHNLRFILQAPFQSKLGVQCLSALFYAAKIQICVLGGAGSTEAWKAYLLFFI